MPNPSNAAVTAAHSCLSRNPKRSAPRRSSPGGAVSNVIPFDRLTDAVRQRVAEAQTLRRAQAVRALEEVGKHVTEAVKLLEPFRTALFIAPTACALKMCAHNMGRVFDDLDHFGLAESAVAMRGASAVQESATVLALVGVQQKGGAA